MKNLALLLPWLGILAGVLYLALHPDTGVIYHHPMTAIGLGLMGLGMIVEARRRPSASSQRH